MPTVDDRLRHLILTGVSQTYPFVQVNQGGRPPGKAYPPRDPEAHAQALGTDLSRIISTHKVLMANRETLDLQDVTGSYVTFELK